MAACIITEMEQIWAKFPSSRHIASWTGVSPGNNESAGKKSAKIVPRNPLIKSALCKVTWAISRSKNTSMASARRGKKKALSQMTLSTYRFQRILRQKWAIKPQTLRSLAIKHTLR